MPNYHRRKGQPITFSVSAEGTQELYYQWFAPSGAIDKDPVLGKNSLKLSNLSSKDAGCYYCIAYNGSYWDTNTKKYNFLHDDESECFNLDVIEIAPIICIMGSGNRTFTAGKGKIHNVSLVKLYNSGYTKTSDQGKLRKAQQSGKFNHSPRRSTLSQKTSTVDIFNSNGSNEIDSSTFIPIKTSLPGRRSLRGTILSKAGDQYPEALVWKVTIRDDKDIVNYNLPWERAYDLRDYYFDELPTGDNQYSGSANYSVPSEGSRGMSIEWSFPEPSYPLGAYPTGGHILGYPDMSDGKPSNLTGCVFNAVIKKTGTHPVFAGQAGISPLSGEKFLTSQIYDTNYSTYGTGREYVDFITYDTKHSGDIAINFYGDTFLESGYLYQVVGGNYDNSQLASNYGGGETIKYKEASITGNVSKWKVHIKRNIEGSYGSGITTIPDFGLVFQDHYENILDDNSHPTNGTLIDLYEAAPVSENVEVNRYIDLHTQGSNPGVIFVANKVKHLSGALPSDHYYISNKESFKPTGVFNDFNGYFARCSGQESNGPLLVTSGYGITGDAGENLHLVGLLPKNFKDDWGLTYGHWRTKSDCTNWMENTRIVNTAICLNVPFEDPDYGDCWGGIANCPEDGNASCGCGEHELRNSVRYNHEIDNGDGYLQAWGFLHEGATLKANLTHITGQKTFMYGHLLIADLPNGTGSYSDLIGKGYAQAPLFRTYINGIEV